MAGYQVALIEKPEGWEAATPDDSPPNPGALGQVIAESDDLFGAVRRAIQHNEAPQRRDDRRWAVVVQRGSLGRTWPPARLCTPVVYKVTAIWWPVGWDPNSPLDVPNCVWRAHGQTAEEAMTYPRALATMRSLNQQSIDHSGTMWYVVVAVENEPISRTVTYDPSGTETTVEVRRLHVIRSETGRRGDCSHCPAHGFDCAKSDWSTLEQTFAETHSRAADSEC
jgi:hypothetical protein